MKIKARRSIAGKNANSITRPEKEMTVRSLVIAAVLAFPVASVADEPLDGEATFKAKCQACHALNQVQGLLEPKPTADRPAHLTKFLKTHPAKLNEAEKEAVIAFLSRR
jgi:mono/diheme cytochrome c family protein